MAASTDDYLAVVAGRRAEALVVTTMTASKVWPFHSDTTADLNYLPSAMSHASDLALGLALARPARRVLCLNGDGSLLMNLGTLVTAAAARARNLAMFVLSNGAYRIVGGAPIPGARDVRWGEVARGCGWTSAGRCESADELAASWDEMLQMSGPLLIELVVSDPPDLRQRLPPRSPGSALREMRQAVAESESGGEA